VARILYLSQVGTVFLIVAIFLATVVSYWNEKFSKQVEEAILRLERGAQQMEDHIRGEFGVQDLNDAINGALKAKLILLDLFLKLTEKLDGNR
jgi:hypothetical protein